MCNDELTDLVMLLADKCHFNTQKYFCIVIKCHKFPITYLIYFNDLFLHLCSIEIKTIQK